MFPPELDITEREDLDEFASEFVHPVGAQDVSSDAFKKSSSTATWKSVNGDKDDESCIPCPAEGDSIVFTSDVDLYVKSAHRRCESQGGNMVSRYAVLEMDDDALSFVISMPMCREARVFRLLEAKPGFDSTSIWGAEDDHGDRWLICVHFPVSGRKPLPESCAEFLMPCPIVGRLGETFVQAYPLKDVVTLSSWRASQEEVSPRMIFHLVEIIARHLEQIFATGHALLRISPDTIVIDEETVRFFGIIALDQPWNERCALAHRQVEYATIPPECFGFLRQSMTPEQGVYILASIAYYLVAGARVPTGESIGYDVAVDARAYHPSFPIGWDELIHCGLRPNPETRFRDIPAFMQALRDALETMERRCDFHEPVQYDFAVDTHIGIAKRLRCPVNQDAVLMRSALDGQRIMMVVADGVSTSTYGSGDIASGLLIETAERIWNQQIANARKLDAETLVNQIFFSANDAICDYIQEHYADKSPQPSECMGTTALVALIDQGVLTLGAIGDSRAYLIRNASMCCITRDHNLFTIGLINGLPLEMCATHPHAGSLVQCLGYYEDEKDRDTLAFDLYSMKLMPGDNLLMTTDGILDYVACDILESEMRIAETVRCARNAGLACLELIMQANMGGGGDNCGVGIVRVSEAKSSSL